MKLIEEENKMKTFSYHLEAIIATFKTLIKGRFLVFLIPGLVIALIFFYLMYDSEPDTDESGILDSIFVAFDYIKDAILGFLENFIILVILSPVMSILSENYDAYLTGQKYQFDILKLLNDVIRAVFVVFIAMILEFTVLVLLFMFGLLIPDSLDPYINFITGAFFYGFSFYDYSLERYSENTMSSLWFAFTRPLTMILTGSIFSLIMFVPIVGIALAPVLTVMISTVVYIKIRGIKVYEDGYVEPTTETQPELPNEEQKTLEN